MYYNRYQIGEQMLDSTASAISSHKKWGYGKWSLFFIILALLFAGAGRMIPMLTNIGIIFGILGVGLIVSVLTKDLELSNYPYLMYVLLPFQLWGIAAVKFLQIFGFRG
tara:strand:+ start:135 stop:461 length:327 start_codon:yes stop_codon:yes gene_type:complete